jgi:hypothetical protein
VPPAIENPKGKRKLGPKGDQSSLPLLVGDQLGGLAT